MKGLLLDDRWAPVTSEMGFLAMEVEQAVRAFVAWQGGLHASRGITVGARPVSGPLEQVLSTLLPLTDAEMQRNLFLPTRGPWTAYLDNDWRGTYASGPMRHMARTWAAGPCASSPSPTPSGETKAALVP